MDSQRSQGHCPGRSCLLKRRAYRSEPTAPPETSTLADFGSTPEGTTKPARRQEDRYGGGNGTVGKQLSLLPAWMPGVFFSPGPMEAYHAGIAQRFFMLAVRKSQHSGLASARGCVRAVPPTSEQDLADGAGIVAKACSGYNVGSRKTSAPVARRAWHREQSGSTRW